MKREQFEDAGQEMDRVRAAEAELQASPSRLFDRLNRLWATQRAYALTWGMMAPRSKEDRRFVRSHFEKHHAAAKCIRRRIDRLVRKGVL